MTTKEKPLDFKSAMRVGGIIFRVGDEILLLKRASYKKYGAGQWALCAGKIKKDESYEDGIIRECFEETGIKLSGKDLQRIGTYYHSPDVDRAFEMEWVIFEVKKETKPEIIVNSEHDEYAWVHINDLFTYDLIEGDPFCLHDYLQNKL